VSVVVVSDYGKGGLSNVPQIISLANQRAIPVVVDPKGTDFSDYREATIVTPNTSEFVQSVGDCPTTEEFNKKAYSLIEKLSLQGLLVTRGPDGMTLFVQDGTFVNQPSNAKQVYDVSGAGDTVVAAIAVFLGCGMSWSEILEYANIAAGIVVGKFGTATVTLPEIVRQLERVTA
jgi:D-beta-D-heptose 7-phosphate kinase/D-beta-D-heptose 1-phosphate adenosyltransferase